MSIVIFRASRRLSRHWLSALQRRQTAAYHLSFVYLFIFTLNLASRRKYESHPVELTCFSVQHIAFSDGGTATCEQLEECSASLARNPPPLSSSPHHLLFLLSIHWFEAPDRHRHLAASWVLTVVPPGDFSSPQRVHCNRFEYDPLLRR